MNLFEGVLIANIVMLLYCFYSIGKIKSEIEDLYQGLAVVMMQQDNDSTRH